MAVMQMQKVSICALNKHRKNILEDVQKLGFMEIAESMDSENEFEKLDTSGARSAISKNAISTEKALEIIDLYAPREVPAFAGFKGKPVLNGDIYELGAANEKKLLGIVDRLTELDREIVALRADNVRLDNQIEELTPWEKMDVPMETKGTKSSVFFVGTIPEDISERKLEERIALENPDVTGYALSKVSGTQDMTYLAVLCLKSEEKPLEDALRKIGFSRPSSLVGEVPGKARENMKAKISENNKEIETLTNEIGALADNYDDLRMFADYSRIRSKKYEVLGALPHTKNVFAFEGYVPAAYTDALKNALSKYDCIIEAKEVPEDEDAPVLLKNSWFGSVGEGTVESFGLPNKREIDPSFIMMIFYVIFFGLMLSDAAYGLVLSLGTGIMLLKFPKIDKGMKSLLTLFFLCGFSTAFWGVLFGGYFGDVLDVVARTFFGVQLAEGANIIPPLWFAPLNNPMQMLIYSLLFGLIHMYVGLIISIYQNIKNKDVAGTITSVSSGLFILGLVLTLLPTDLFEGIAQMEFNFPEFMGTLTLVMTLVGLAGIILFASAETKNPALRVLLGLYEVYNNITGWLSDTLSYSRLLALGLATGVIAQVINQMGSMFGGGVIGAILFIVIFIGGHIFNLAINVLGAYVHTCRLQYVEFFGKFYEGGGKKFGPFLAETKYVDINKGGH